jgi:hypothetical protein
LSTAQDNVEGSDADIYSKGDWQASSSHNNKTKFTAIDLSEGEWYDYDEKAGEEVSVKEMVWEIRRNV